MSNAQILFSIALGVVSLIIFGFAVYVFATVTRNSKGPVNYVNKSEGDSKSSSHGNLLENHIS